MPNTTEGRGLPEAQASARFRVLFGAHYVALLGYALRRVTIREDAADVVADTFLVAWRRLPDVPSAAEERPWLYGVARAVLANHRRGEIRRGRLADVLRAELRSMPGLTSQEPDRVEAAPVFASLRDDDREILALASWEGLGPAEIGVVLGCSANAAKVRLHHARRRLEDALGEFEGKPIDSPGHETSGRPIPQARGARYDAG